MSLGSGSPLIAVSLFQPGPIGPWRLGGNEASRPGPRRDAGASLFAWRSSF